MICRKTIRWFTNAVVIAIKSLNPLIKHESQECQKVGKGDIAVFPLEEMAVQEKVFVVFICFPTGTNRSNEVKVESKLLFIKSTKL